MTKSIKTGWLTKKGHIIKNWKKRFIVLTRDSLTYYTDSTLSNKRGEFVFHGCDLSDICVSNFPDTTSKPYRFALQNIVSGAFLELCATDSGEKKEWVKELTILLRGEDTNKTEYIPPISFVSASHVPTCAKSYGNNKDEQEECSDLNIHQNNEDNNLKRMSDAKSYFLASDSDEEDEIYPQKHKQQQQRQERQIDSDDDSDIDEQTNLQLPPENTLACSSAKCTGEGVGSVGAGDTTAPPDTKDGVEKGAVELLQGTISNVDEDMVSGDMVVAKPTCSAVLLDDEGDCDEFSECGSDEDKLKIDLTDESLAGGNLEDINDNRDDEDRRCSINSDSSGWDDDDEDKNDDIGGGRIAAGSDSVCAHGDHTTPSSSRALLMSLPPPPPPPSVIIPSFTTSSASSSTSDNTHHLHCNAHVDVVLPDLDELLLQS